MTKAEIRRTEGRRRRELSLTAAKCLNDELLARFASLDLRKVETVHVFLPIAGKNEPDTFRLIRWLREFHPGIRIIVPRADFATATMTSYLYPGEDALENNPYQIPEPVNAELYEGSIDLILVPLLAFDLNGYRVGYGKGFYDRFLEGSAAIKAGLSFFGPVAAITDVHEQDIRLDLCITPGEVFDFRGTDRP